MKRNSVEKGRDNVSLKLLPLPCCILGSQFLEIGFISVSIVLFEVMPPSTTSQRLHLSRPLFRYAMAAHVVPYSNYVKT
jgi:hypothetical protein